jgi:hypothetical protein
LIVQKSKTIVGLAAQQQDSHKCYVVHAPEVKCSAEGKANKKYEFDYKVAVVTISMSN